MALLMPSTGALRSTDEQHASFRRAMETAAAERKLRTTGRSSGKRGAGDGGPSGDRRGQPPPAAAGAAAPAERDSRGAAGSGTGGVLESRDELHSSFHRAMAEAAAAEEAAREAAAAAEATRRYAAESSGKRRAGGASPSPAQAAQPSPQGPATSAASPSSEGVLASLRRRQEEASKAQRSLAGLAARIKGGRWAAALWGLGSCVSWEGLVASFVRSRFACCVHDRYPSAGWLLDVQLLLCSAIAGQARRLCCVARVSAVSSHEPTWPTPGPVIAMCDNGGKASQRGARLRLIVALQGASAAAACKPGPSAGGGGRQVSTTINESIEKLGWVHCVEWPAGRLLRVCAPAGRNADR